MKKKMMLTVTLVSLGLIVVDAEARRLGGGSSLGKQRSMTTQPAPKTPPQQTDVVTLNAEVLEVVTEGEVHVASVRFSGMIRDCGDDAPASREQGSRLRDATGRESGAAPSCAGVASVSGVTSPEGAPVPPSDGAAETLSEVWHLEKPVDGSTGWLISGIQQD